MHRLLTAALFLLTVLPALAQGQVGEAPWSPAPGVYDLNPETVEMAMTARRTFMSPIRAQFGTVAGNLVVAPETASTVRVIIAAGDLTANGPIVEGLLKGEDFLNTEAFPEIAFAADDFVISEEPAELTGVLTMAGVSHPASFTARLVSRDGNGENGPERLRFVVEGELERANWGMTGYRALVSGKVTIRIEADFVRSLPPGAVD